MVCSIVSFYAATGNKDNVTNVAWNLPLRKEDLKNEIRELRPLPINLHNTTKKNFKSIHLLLQLHYLTIENIQQSNSKSFFDNSSFHWLLFALCWQFFILQAHFGKILHLVSPLTTFHYVGAYRGIFDDYFSNNLSTLSKVLDPLQLILQLSNRFRSED